MTSRTASLVERWAPARLGPGFRRLLASSWTTNLGDGIAGAAAPLLVASLTDDPRLIALAAGLRWAAPLVLGLGAGVVTDRLDRRTVVVTANVVRLGVLAALLAALVTGRGSVAAALTAVALLAASEVFADNAAAALVPTLVARDDLPLATSRVMTGFVTLDQLVGPSLGAVLFAVGTVVPFAAEAVLVAAGAWLLAGVGRRPARTAAPDAAGGDRRSVRGDLAEAVRFTLHQPAVRTLALTILVFNVTFGAAWSVLVVYAHERLHLGAAGFGLLTTASAVGGLLGTSAYGRLTARFSLARLMQAGLVIETLTHLGLALTTSAPVALAILVAFGAHAFVWGTTTTAVRQRFVPTEMQGRVGAVYGVCVYSTLVLGSGLGGLLAARWGATAPFWFAFTGSALFVVLLWRQFALITHDDAPRG